MSFETQVHSSLSRPKLWRWIVGTLAILIFWQVLGLTLTILLGRYFGYDLQLLFSTEKADLAQVREFPPWSTAATVLISFLPLFVAPLLAYRYLLKRPYKQLFTSAEKIFVAKDLDWLSGPIGNFVSAGSWGLNT